MCTMGETPEVGLVKKIMAHGLWLVRDRHVSGPNRQWVGSLNSLMSRVWDLAGSAH
jgi:hypothetical protein